MAADLTTTAPASVPCSTPSAVQTPFMGFRCAFCAKTFRTRQGAAVHEGRVHGRAGSAATAATSSSNASAASPSGSPSQLSRSTSPSQPLPRRPQPPMLVPVAGPEAVASVVERIRFAVKDALLRFAKPLPGNRERMCASLALDLHESEFIAVFGGLAQLCVSQQQRGTVPIRRYSVSLVGAEIRDALDPLLGADWWAADAEDQRLMHYVRTFNRSLDLYFTLDITFRVALRVFNERASRDAQLVRRMYRRGNFCMSFQATATSRRTDPVPPPPPPTGSV